MGTAMTEKNESAIDVQLRELDPAALQELASQATGRSILDPGEWQWHQISGGGTPPTVGVYRVSGTGRDRNGLVPWSLVIKAIRRPYTGHESGSANAGADDPTARAYWQREILAYQSGFLTALPEGLSAPRCFGVTEQPGDMVWLWLEDLRDPGVPEDAPWPLARYALAARHFGTFNGVYLTQRPPQEARAAYPWLRFPNPSDERAPDIRLLFDERTWRDPRLAGAFDRPMVDRLLAQWEHRAALFEACLRLPRTICHGDAHRRNLFGRRGLADETVTAAIDWASVGALWIGGELNNLVMGSIIVKSVPAADGAALDAAVFPAYVDGLRAAGWQGDSRLPRFGFVAAAALAAAPTLHWFLVSVLERGGRDGPEDTYPAPTTVQLARWSGYTRFSLDLGDEALDLLRLI